jgi:hypothetical protein
VTPTPETPATLGGWLARYTERQAELEKVVVYAMVERLWMTRDEARRVYRRIKFALPDTSP